MLVVAMSRIVREWYNARAEYEWKRLFRDRYRQLEYLITMQVPPAHVEGSICES